MKYWELLKEENEAVAERHELAMERIGHMKEEATVGEPYRAFFERTVQFIELIEETFQKQMDGTLATMSQEEAAEFNRTLYADILPGAYGKSFANPDYAAKELGEDYGPWLSFLYTEIRSAIVYAYESRLVDVTVLEELFIEVYNLFEGGTPELAELREPLYYFVSDYCDRMLPESTRTSPAFSSFNCSNKSSTFFPVMSGPMPLISVSSSDFIFTLMRDKPSFTRIKSE